MKKLFKILGILLLLGIIILAVLYFTNNETQPKGNAGEKAELLAQKILKAVNAEAWDTTNFVTWTFRGERNYIWDRKRHLVRVSWEEKEVLLNPNEISGKAFSNGPAILGNEGDKLVKQAWSYFCNDSFWLLAFTKLYDKGVERSLVQLEDGREGLMVRYASGGVTPGDSYLWLVDDNGLPTSWKMWVSIIPVGGMEFTWEDWKTLPTGAKVATNHKSKALEIPLTNLKAGQTLGDIGIEKDIFKELN